MATPGMATSQSSKGAGGMSELKQRLWFVLGALIVFRYDHLCQSLVLTPLY